MDWITETRLRQQFQNLDRALERNDRIAAMLAQDEINRLLAQGRPKPSEPSLTAGLPRWVNEMIENKGVRLRSVENALNVNSVVVSPTFGKSGYGVKLEIRF